MTIDIRERFVRVFHQLQNDPKTSLLATAQADPAWFYEISKIMIPREIKADIQTTVALVELSRQTLAERALNVTPAPALLGPGPVTETVVAEILRDESEDGDEG